MINIFKKIPVLIFLSILAFPTIVSALPANPPNGSTLEQRAKLRTDEQRVKLTEKEITRYKTRCIKTQNTVREIQNKLAPIITKRQLVYKKVDAKLWITIGQLKLAGKDTFTLEAERAEFAKRVDVYNNILNQYNQTLDDIVVMNCEADLNAFIARVKTAREYHQALRTQSEDIKTHIVDNVKSTLSDFATSLQPKASTEKE